MQGGGAANNGLTNTCAATLRLPCVPRAGLGKPWSASNANKPASSWLPKQDPKTSRNMAARKGPRLYKKQSGTQREKKHVLTLTLMLLWGDIGLARNMCKFQPHKPGPTQTPCAPPVRELWVACSATQELPTRPSYAPKTLEQKRKSVGTKKAVLEVLGQKKFTLDTQVTHWHTASKRCQPA